MLDSYRKRRIIISIILLTLFVCVIIINTPNLTNQNTFKKQKIGNNMSSSALSVLEKLALKGRAPKTGYSRTQFGDGWIVKNGCDTRNIILNRDMVNVKVNEKCDVVSGTLKDLYTGKTIEFMRGSSTSAAVQIDHVVALSNAWQTGAQQLTPEKRIELANDPLELLAVSETANIHKSDGDAATWLPPNKSYRCAYVARQTAVKFKYGLWVTRPEYDAISSILRKCQNQLLPSE